MPTNFGDLCDRAKNSKSVAMTADTTYTLVTLTAAAFHVIQCRTHKRSQLMIDLPGFRDICSRLDTIHECDGQTDGRTDEYRPTASTALTHSVAR